MSSILNEISQDKYQLYTDKTNTESDYIQLNINAFQSIRNGDYQKAKNIYKECITLAKSLDDDYKNCDALTNFGVVQFYLGKLADSVESLESALKIANKLPKDNKSNTILKIKILSNLSLALLSVNKCRDSLDHLYTLIDLIKNEKDFDNQLSYFKSVMYIFFRMDSIIAFFENNSNLFNLNEKIVINNENRSNEEIHKKIVSKIIFYLHKFMRDNDIESWIQCLSEEKENFKAIGDTNGFVFAVFNQYVSVFSQNPNDMESRAKISSIRKVLTSNSNLNSDVPSDDTATDKILKEAKEKMEVSITMYQKLYDLEYNLRLHQSTQEKEQKSPANPKIFFKIFLRYALNYLNDMQNEGASTNDKYRQQMRQQILLTLKLIDNNEIDLSSVKIFNIDPEISNSLKILFENILYIHYKFQVKKCFKKYMKNVLGYSDRQELQQIKEKRFLVFLIKRCNTIIEGDVLTKINYTSSGKKEHFYKLVPDQKCIQVYAKKTDKTFKTLDFNSIERFAYGISSENLRKRFKNIKNTQLKNPWLFFSIIMQDRSIDLYLEPAKLNDWFYGITYYLRQINMLKKIISVNDYLLTRMKLKLIYALKEYYENNKKVENDRYRSVVNALIQEIKKN